MNVLHTLSARSILANGSALQGTIVGIHVWETGGGEDSPVVTHFAWAVEAAGAVYGVHQRLNPADHVRIGMPVDLRVEKQKAVIDWGTERGDQWKPSKTAPAPGIRDDRKGNDPRGARDVWTAATVTLGGTRDRKSMFGLVTATDIAATVTVGDETWPLDVRKRRAPFYAAHLWREGVPIPAWVNPKNRNAVFIDWTAAAIASPGIGEEPARITMTTERIALGAAAPSAVAEKKPIELAEPGARPLDKKGNVSWETFLEITQGIVKDQLDAAQSSVYAERFGVPPGTWPQLQMMWLGKMRWNPKMSIQYGQALTKALPPGWTAPTA